MLSKHLVGTCISPSEQVLVQLPALLGGLLKPTYLRELVAALLAISIAVLKVRSFFSTYISFSYQVSMTRLKS